MIFLDMYCEHGNNNFFSSCYADIFADSVRDLKNAKNSIIFDNFLYSFLLIFGRTPFDMYFLIQYNTEEKF